jgi:DNA adenine methylase
MSSVFSPILQRSKLHPILKWAGGKGQLLEKLSSCLPAQYNKYIEPFVGGGALFFHIQAQSSIISDINPELINLYKQVAFNLEEVLSFLDLYENTSECFYLTRSKRYSDLSSAEAASRTIFLNKTCFNGLYRVNRTGHFNVPFGKYKNPKIYDLKHLEDVSTLLQKAKIVEGNYLDVLAQFAEPNDLIFLDPPYLPISKNADFKRYTKEQFHEDDHQLLAKEVKRLYDLGCHIILTNSNHPLVHELYGDYGIEIINTKRFISCRSGESRTGEDVLVNIPSKLTHSSSLKYSSLLTHLS